MQHKEWQDLIPFYVAQTLSADVIRRFEAHLAGCDTCQREIDEWRILASAVWREADNIARELPPLSQEVYNRLNYRDRAPQSRYSSNPPVQQQAMPDNMRVLPQSKRRSLPLTMVAGLIVAVIFGGLLIMLALRQNPGPQEIALNLTESGDVTDEFGGVPVVDSTATSTPITGIIPTMETGVNPSATYTPGPPMFFTNTPIASNTVLPSPTIMPSHPPETATPEIALLPPQTTTDASSSAILALPPTDEPTETPSPVAPIGGGPYITVTPGTYANGLPLCEAFNPTTIPFEIFVRADRNTELAGVIQPGEVVPVYQVALTGWYLVELSDGTQGWLQFGFAYLRGNCTGDLPVATVVASPTALIGTPQINIEQPTGDTIVVINASFADLYRGPGFESAVIGVAGRDEQFVALGYQGTGTNRWVMVQLEDGSQGWIWASVVTEYPASEAPTPSSP